jgi:hypothetical protein
MKKKVPSEKEIAKKHGVSVDAIIKQSSTSSSQLDRTEVI